jgi:hypothetical protein
MPEASKQRNCSKRFLSIHFLNHASVVIKERYAILTLNKMFYKTYMLCKVVYFLPCLTSHITYRTLRTETYFFLSLCSFGVTISKLWKYR